MPKGNTFPENAFSDKPSSFEDGNPGTAVINQTSRGTIYNMPWDNMAVLVPDMNTVENMPGGNRNYKLAPRSNMPNPLRPQLLPEKKNTKP